MSRTSESFHPRPRRPPPLREVTCGGWRRCRTVRADDASTKARLRQLELLEREETDLKASISAADRTRRRKPKDAYTAVERRLGQVSNDIATVGL